MKKIIVSLIISTSANAINGMGYLEGEKEVV